PTPIQEQSIPPAMAGRDVLGLAQTGTGKTAAFALPILHHLATTPAKKGIRCLVIAPTRELAEQIHDTFNTLGVHLRIKSVSIYGGVAKGPQLGAVRRGAQVVVACPGRLLDHVQAKDINLSGVEILVLDEADTMFDMGFLPDVRRIISHLPEKRQNLMFSATMPKEIRSLAMTVLKDPETVQIGTIAPAKTVSHALYPVPDKLKKNLLLALLAQTPTGRALVFTRTKHRARTLALDLAKESYRVTALQGNMSQTARQRAMNGFRAGNYDILVATDIAAHGIDVPDVSHVINYDFPNTSDTYTHRIGRTGRAEQSGEAFTLAIAEDRSMVREVERDLGVTIERRRLDGFDYGSFKPEDQFREQRPGQRQSAPYAGNGARSNGARSHAENGNGARQGGRSAGYRGQRSGDSRFNGPPTSAGPGRNEDGRTPNPRSNGPASGGQANADRNSQRRENRVAGAPVNSQPVSRSDGDAPRQRTTGRGAEPRFNGPNVDGPRSNGRSNGNSYSEDGPRRSSGGPRQNSANRGRSNDYRSSGPPASGSTLGRSARKEAEAGNRANNSPNGRRQNSSSGIWSGLGHSGDDSTRAPGGSQRPGGNSPTGRPAQPTKPRGRSVVRRQARLAR
ncbi:MAG: hypothetical protein BZY83_08525, partial [SAR202 cluster bacterium Casp-Chloro-G2]